MSGQGRMGGNRTAFEARVANSTKPPETQLAYALRKEGYEVSTECTKEGAEVHVYEKIPRFFGNFFSKTFFVGVFEMPIGSDIKEPWTLRYDTTPQSRERMLDAARPVAQRYGVELHSRPGLLDEESP